MINYGQEQSHSHFWKPPILENGQIYREQHLPLPLWLTLQILGHALILRHLVNETPIAILCLLVEVSKIGVQLARKKQVIEQKENQRSILWLFFCLTYSLRCPHYDSQFRIIKKASNWLHKIILVIVLFDGYNIMVRWVVRYVWIYGSPGKRKNRTYHFGGYGGYLKKSDWGRNKHLSDMAHSERCAKACWYSKKSRNLTTFWLLSFILF